GRPSINRTSGWTSYQHGCGVDLPMSQVVAGDRGRSVISKGTTHGSSSAHAKSSRLPTGPRFIVNYARLRDQEQPHVAVIVRVWNALAWALFDSQLLEFLRRWLSFFNWVFHSNSARERRGQQVEKTMLLQKHPIAVDQTEPKLNAFQTRLKKNSINAGLSLMNPSDHQRGEDNAVFHYTVNGVTNSRERIAVSGEYYNDEYQQ
ncbi:hypothetical protein Ocin01_12905, partial [Orchesella cincta]